MCQTAELSSSTIFIIIIIIKHKPDYSQFDLTVTINHRITELFYYIK